MFCALCAQPLEPRPGGLDGWLQCCAPAAEGRKCWGYWAPFAPLKQDLWFPGVKRFRDLFLYRSANWPAKLAPWKPK